MVLSYRLLLFIIFLFNLFAKMNLTSTIKLEQVEKEIEENQRFMTKWIDDYEYKVRRLENFINILDNTRNQNVTKLERETKSGELLEIPWKNYKADSINITISLTGYLTFQKNYNVKINYTVSNSFK